MPDCRYLISSPDLARYFFRQLQWNYNVTLTFQCSLSTNPDQSPTVFRREEGYLPR